MPRWSTSRPKFAPPVVAAMIWVVVWAVLALTGQRYSLRALYAGYQFAPADALLSDPVGSVVHLHTQPPLWNLLVGMLGATSPLGLVATYSIMSVAFGVLLTTTLCAILLRIGASPRWAIAWTVVATTTTSVMAHAFEPRYDFAVMAMLSLLVWAVFRSGDAGVRWPLLVPVIAATALTMTRTLYHPVWLVGLIAVVYWGNRHRISYRQLGAVILIPAALVGATMIKNKVVVDEFTLSTMTGMNLARSVTPAADAERLAAQTERGEISTIWADGVAGWTLARPCVTRPGDHPALSTELRVLPQRWQTSPFDDGLVPNYNSRCMVAAYQQAADDAVVVTLDQPGAWVRGRAWSVSNWFEIEDRRVQSDTSALWGPLDVWSRGALLGVPHPPMPESWAMHSMWVQSWPISLTQLVLTGVVLATAFGRARRSYPRVGQVTDLGLIVVGWIVAWTFVVGIMFELGEQVRFRGAVDPLVFGIGAWLVTAEALELIARQRARARHVVRIPRPIIPDEVIPEIAAARSRHPSAGLATMAHRRQLGQHTL